MINKITHGITQWGVILLFKPEELKKSGEEAESD